MNRQLIIFAITILLCGHVVSYKCPTTMLSSKTYTCSDPAADHILDSTDFAVPTGQTTLSISFEIKVTADCIAVPYSMATFYFSPGGTDTKLVDLTYDATSFLYMKWWSFQTNTESSMFAKLVSPLAGSWIGVGMTFDLVAGGFSGGALYLPTSLNTGSITSSYSYSSLTDFADTSLKLSLCSGMGGTPTVACEIGNVKVIYKTYAAKLPLLFGTTSVPVVVNKFKEGQNYQVENFGGLTAPTYLGSSTSSFQDTTNSPLWTSGESGLNFTAINQYITIPTYTHGPLNGYPGTASVGITFWLKLNEAPTSANFTLFSYSNATHEQYGTKINTARKLISRTQSYWTATSTYALNVSQWTQISLWFVVIDTGTNTGYMLANFGGDQAFGGASLTSPRSILKTADFKSTDIVKIGGFIGQISDLRIFSPSSLIMNNPSCDSSCPYDIGALNPPLCLQPECGAGSYATGSCVSCPSLCAICTASGVCATCPGGETPVNGVCVSGLSCPSGEYEDNGGSCQTCTNNCKTCLSSTTCLSCTAKFAFSSQTCTSCPAKKYALTDTSSTCTGDCASNCDVCTGPSAAECETCSSGHHKEGSNCVQDISCSAGQYQDNGACHTCTNNCKTCSSPTTCLSCSAKFSFNSPTCSSCPAKKYALTDTSSTCTGDCSTNCDVCTGPSAAECETCSSGHHKEGSNCVPDVTCSAGQYKDNGGTCQTCTNNCKTCSSSTTCLSCTAKFSFNSPTCSSCPAKKYALTDTSSTCTGDCASNCDVCTGPSAAECETCSSGHHKEGSNCVPDVTCSAGQYQDNGACHTCTNNCKTCSSSTTCLSCSAKFSFNSPTCSSCPAKKYALTDTSSTCTGDCSTNCEVCTGPSGSECETCSSGYHKEGSDCVQDVACPSGSSCSTCTSTGACATCPLSVIPVNGFCCPAGEYPDNSGVCHACTNNCKTCTSATACLSCTSVKLYLDSSQACTTCPAGKYALTDTSSTCSGNCPSNCDVCTSSSTCETCSSGYNKDGSTCAPTVVESETEESLSSGAAVGIAVGTSIFGVSSLGVLLYFRKSIFGSARSCLGGGRQHRKIAQSPPSQIKDPQAQDVNVFDT